jgi:hypothetical protein
VKAGVQVFVGARESGAAWGAEHLDDRDKDLNRERQKRHLGSSSMKRECVSRRMERMAQITAIEQTASRPAFLEAFPIELLIRSP